MSEIQDSPKHLQPVLAGAPLDRVVPVTKGEMQTLAVAGYQFFDQGQWEKARNIFAALTALAPTSDLGFAGLGALALKESKMAEAFHALSKALELSSNDPGVYANLGELVLRMGKPTEAARLLRCAAEMDPGKRHPAANRARAMLEGIEEAQSSKSS